MPESCCCAFYMSVYFARPSCSGHMLSWFCFSGLWKRCESSSWRKMKRTLPAMLASRHQPKHAGAHLSLTLCKIIHYFPLLPECNSLQSVIRLSSVFHGMLSTTITCQFLYNGMQLPYLLLAVVESHSLMYCCHRRRRGNQAVYMDQIHASAPPLAGRSPSPNTHRCLSSTLSSLEDDSNKYAQALMRDVLDTCLYACTLRFTLFPVLCDSCAWVQNVSCSSC